MDTLKLELFQSFQCVEIGEKYRGVFCAHYSAFTYPTLYLITNEHKNKNNIKN